MNSVTIPFPEYEFPSKKLNFVDAPFLKTFFFDQLSFFISLKRLEKNIVEFDHCTNTHTRINVNYTCLYLAEFFFLISNPR